MERINLTLKGVRARPVLVPLKRPVVSRVGLFHDWPEETCLILAKRFAEALNPKGEIWIHDAFLDEVDGAV